MTKYKYLLGLLVFTLGACQNHPMKHEMNRDMKHGMNRDMKHEMNRDMQHGMRHKGNLKLATTLEELKEYNIKQELIGKKAFEKGDYATAFNFAIEDSQKTKGFSLNAIGTMYHFGYGVEVDYKRAKDLYERALEYGNGEAANHLARMYLNGEGVEKNTNRAHEYYKISCDKGYSIACKFNV